MNLKTLIINSNNFQSQKFLISEILNYYNNNIKKKLFLENKEYIFEKN